MPFLVLILLSALALVVVLGAATWGVVLERRYTGPYSLQRASSRDKWTRASTLAFWQTFPMAALGLYLAFYFANTPVTFAGRPLPLASVLLCCCGAGWIVFFPIAVLVKHWGLARQLKSYRRVDAQIRRAADAYSHPHSWIQWFLTSEQRRFFKEGFAESEEHEHVDRGMHPNPTQQHTTPGE